MCSSDAASAATERLDGRLPVLPAERIYKSYASLLWTTAVLSAASYAYLVGSTFHTFGDAKLAIAGYLIGLILGEVVVSLAGGIPSWRYGIDTIDASKAALGTRGSVVLLITVLATWLGWADVLIAMPARGVGRLVTLGVSMSSASGETVVVVATLLLLALTWLLAQRGPAAMERLSTICAPVQIIVALLIGGLLAAKFGVAGLSAATTSARDAVTTDPLAQIAYGVEFGFDNALTLLPFLGGLTRLVRDGRHVIGPTVLGSGIIGAYVIASVAGLAGGVYAASDPTIWIVTLAGTGLGALIVGFLLVANVGTLVVQVYVAGVAVQQARALTVVPWKWVLAIILTPGVLIAFHTSWLLDRVMNWLAYNGVMFVGLNAVLFTDYYLVRRRHLEPAHLFARPGQGRYWYSVGVNWTALAGIAAPGALYLPLFDPVSLRSRPLFRYLGAGIPRVVLGGLVYYVAMRLQRNAAGSLMRPGGEASAAKPVEVGL